MRKLAKDNVEMVNVVRLKVEDNTGDKVIVWDKDHDVTAIGDTYGEATERLALQIQLFVEGYEPGGDDR
jgi:hypothetical protein